MMEIAKTSSCSLLNSMPPIGGILRHRSVNATPKSERRPGAPRVVSASRLAVLAAGSSRRPEGGTRTVTRRPARSPRAVAEIREFDPG